MGLFDWLTGVGSATKAAENVTDIGKTITGGIVSGIDALVLTDEEKVQYSHKAGALYLDFYKTYSQENSEQSKARRELAIMTFKVYFFLVLAGVAVYKFDSEYGLFIFGIAKAMTWLVGMVAGAYFIPHQISKVYTNNKSGVDLGSKNTT